MNEAVPNFYLPVDEALPNSSPVMVSPTENSLSLVNSSLPLSLHSVTQTTGHTNTNSLSLVNSSLPLSLHSVTQTTGHTNTNSLSLVNSSLPLSLHSVTQTTGHTNTSPSLVNSSLPLSLHSVTQTTGHTNTSPSLVNSSLPLSLHSVTQTTGHTNTSPSLVNSSLPLSLHSVTQTTGHTNTSPSLVNSSLPLSLHSVTQTTGHTNTSPSLVNSSLPLSLHSVTQTTGHTNTSPSLVNSSLPLSLHSVTQTIGHTNTNSLSLVNSSLPLTIPDGQRSSPVMVSPNSGHTDSTSLDPHVNSLPPALSLQTNSPVGQSKGSDSYQSSTTTTHSLKPVQTDWSRQTRQQIALLKCASDPKQTVITSYFDMAEKIAHLLESSEEMSNIQHTSFHKEQVNEDSNLCPLLKKLLRNATLNASRLPKQRRHEEVLKKFATSLLIYSGPLAYEFVHRNLPEALPSLRTVQRTISSQFQSFHEGVFCFDELLKHLEAYKAPLVVSIGEDATRLISRVQYDSETDKVVGFVLPCNAKGLPLTDSFMATSFKDIEDYFATTGISKYAFVYMAQAMSDGVPAFCLACIGNNNQFTAELVLKRWQYLHSECKKRGITIISFGADGDSREMKSMQVSSHILPNSNLSPLSSLSPSNQLPVLPIPSAWNSWFAVRRPTTICYVQDIIHIAVKLKSRLLQPSIVLPMGSYLAGVHHLRLLQQNFAKDQHGLREKDINHKDKQNYDAVVRLTSDSVATLLSNISGAKGTRMYLDVIRCVVDSFLDKSLDALSRVELAWTAIFFMRYWRNWLLLNPQYNLQSNFITNNAYMCIELNGHALITAIMTLRQLAPESTCFMPWLLGSQSCEKIFRAARSMTSTFSTIINFDMLGLVRRLHRLHIQMCLESETESTSIVYPRSQAHKAKDGKLKPNVRCVGSVTTDSIRDAVKRGQEKAKKMIEDLGMDDLLIKNKCWKNPPLPAVVPRTSKSEDYENGDEEDEEDDYDEEDLPDKAHISDVMQVIMSEANSTLDGSEIAASISELDNAQLIDKQLSDQLTNLHRQSFKRLPGAMPIFETSSKSTTTPKKQKHKHCPFVEVMHNGKVMYINKTTAVWLLQEGERVSSDRLFRVRNKQPYSTTNTNLLPATSHNTPTTCESIQIGDIAIFTISTESWRMGRVVSFSFYKEKKKGTRMYKSSIVKFSDKAMNLGVLCSWFTNSSDTNAFTLDLNEQVHTFIPISSYICTVSFDCFETIDGAHPTGIARNDPEKVSLLTAQNLSLSQQSLLIIKNLHASHTKSCQSPNSSSQKVIATNKQCSSTSAKSNYWVKCGTITLKKQDLQLIKNDKELTDQHVNAFQNVVKSNFPLIGGLQHTLLQYKSPVQLQDGNGLQILHIDDHHWATLQICNHNTLLYYDSSFSSCSRATMTVISQLVRSSDKDIKIQVMNIGKQAGVTDCALFAMATMACLALDMDPLTVTFDQELLRPHLISILESKKVVPFPVRKNRRIATRIVKLEECLIYCCCRQPMYGPEEIAKRDKRDDREVIAERDKCDKNKEMIGCDNCDEWFHEECISENISEIKKKKKWFCHNCMS